MDYANRQRLKILGQIEIKDAKDAPELIEKLAVTDYKAKIERAVIIHIEAFDWNCPQHITPRFTEAQVLSMVAPLRNRVAELEAALKAVA